MNSEYNTKKKKGEKKEKVGRGDCRGKIVGGLIAIREEK